MQEQEIWKDIKDYEGLYQISNLKRIKSLGNNRNRKEKIIKIRKSQIALSKNGEIKRYSINKLFKATFGEEFAKPKKELIENLEGEEWKEICEDYMISNLGRVKTITNKKEKLCTIKSGAVSIRGQRYIINLLMLEKFGHILLLDEDEEFKDILNYEGLYQISNRKRVFNVISGKILKERYDTYGGYGFVLVKDGKKKTISVDKLYNQAFGEPIEDLENEEWKDICTIEGFEEFIGYQISNMGRVKKVEGNYERLISQSDNGHGYFKIGLHINGKSKPVQVHRLVGLAFVDNDDIENKKELNHINEIKTDNRAENLEWCDRSYNINYGNRTQRQVETARERGHYDKLAETNSKKIYCLELDRVFPSIQSIVDEFGYCRENISCCLRHVDNQQVAYGMHWYYYDEYFKEE